MFINYLISFYGLDQQEMRKFAFLGLIFAFTIGIYWMLSPLRDSIFCLMCGVSNIPLAKFISLFLSIPIVMGYSILITRYLRHQVFYILCAIYALLALIFVYFLAHEVYGVDQINIIKTCIDGRDLFCHTQLISRYLAWALYMYVESFGALMVTLFWSFASDTTKPESASAGFSFVAMGGQLGGIIGPLMVLVFVRKLGEAVLLFWAAIAIILLGICIYVFMSKISNDCLEGYQASKKEHSLRQTSFMQGLKLLLCERYLLGIFAIVAICEVINTIFDYKLRTVAQNIYFGRELTYCFSSFGMWINIIGFLCLILGINKIGLRFGVKKSLLILPCLIGIAVILIYFNKDFMFLWLTNIVIRSFNYAFNQPIKEQLYIPTSKDTRYKAKVWIETFSARGSKVFGSSINYILEFISQDIFLLLSMVLSLGLVGVWLCAAMYVGNRYQEAINTNKTVF